MEAYLRQAVWEDLELLFEWANDPIVRNNSFESGKIPFDVHKEWYQKLLTDQKRKQYIYVYGKKPVGQARVSVAEDKAEISYSICDGERGMGHGRNLLRILKDQVKEDFPEVKYLVAKVKPENISSQRAFLNAGFAKNYEAYIQSCAE